MTEPAPHLDVPIASVDTETDSAIHPDRRAYDIAIIRREPSGEEKITNLTVLDVDLTNADHNSLNVGHFFQRHPRFGGKHDPRAETVSDAQAALKVEEALRGTHIIGCVPNFDTEVFKNSFRRHGLPWSAHYHLMDVENLIVGYLAGLVHYAPERLDGFASLRPPWSSSALSRAVGIEPPNATDRHTALGDARWALDIYDAIVTEQQGKLDVWRATRVA